SVSSVSGIGLFLMGLVAVTAGWYTGLRWPDPTSALNTWMIASLLAFLLGTLGAILKANRLKQSLWNDAVRRFLICLLPALGIGAALTVALLPTAQLHLIPAIWMLCYGAGVLAAGTYAAAILRWMGAAFLGCGAIALFAPGWQPLLLIMSFGIFHLVFGIELHRRYGG
ncbi:MAG: hypothetical protein O3A63_16250, partial [Proteobacteria bacterium]|nr:hypothetical protein [Pseudomonadota bacterium]